MLSIDIFLSVNRPVRASSALNEIARSSPPTLPAVHRPLPRDAGANRRRATSDRGSISGGHCGLMAAVSRSEIALQIKLQEESAFCERIRLSSVALEADSRPFSPG